MLVSESWLREWVSPGITTDELSERLTLAGLEVDSVNFAGPELDNKKVVIGEVCGVRMHPDAQKLKICEVNIGRPTNISIVCGASNAVSGMKTAVALVNAELPGMRVVEREIRGVSSRGMLCSATELGLEDSSSGIIEFDIEAQPGTGVSEYLDLGDKVYQLELTPNRGDCLGMAGVAREVATLTGAKIKLPTIPKIKATTTDAIGVDLVNPEGCPRYVGRAITGINMSAKSPDWLVERLRRSGMRGINVIVDITNYVMHELGQPMHAFDFAKIEGGIVVRMAEQGEKLKLLDGNTVKLKSDNLLIADKGKAIALAGIMGGANTAISSKTKDIYLEAAFFQPSAILGKARQFGMHTDASHRFERGVDSRLQLSAMERATELIMQIAGGKPGPVTHSFEKSVLPKSPQIKFYNSEISRILGITIPVSRTRSIFKKLGMTVSTTKNNSWNVVPPSWRFDITGQHDLVEEVGRCHGFDKVPANMPVSISRFGSHLESDLSLHDVRRSLVNRGYHEVITYSFVDGKIQKQLLDKGNAIRLKNPIADNMSVMRQSLWPGLLDVLMTNLNRQEDRVRLFEMGNVYARARNTRKSVESSKLGGLISGLSLPRQWGSPAAIVDFFDIKGDLEALIGLTGKSSEFKVNPAPHPALHPGQSGKVMMGKNQIGYVGKLHPAHQKLYDIEQAVYLFEIDAEHLSRSLLPAFTEISKFPSVQRDLAVLVDEDVDVQAILELARSSGGKLLKKLELFDVYRGHNIQKNKKSFAFSLTFQSESSNLTSSEVEAVTEEIVHNLEASLGAQLRT
jgi:phenylalanyl-tRNA synthetase beta chain